MTEQNTSSITEFAKSITPFNKYSQFGEDGIIEAIFARIGTTSKWCVECGAADGLLFSNTRKLIEEGWSSVQIESDEARFEELFTRYLGWQVKPGGGRRTDRGPVFCVQRHATDLTEIFHSLSDRPVPVDLDLLVIDVDGQDYHLWNQLLAYHPRLVLCEFDPNAPPEFIPEIGGPGQAGELAIRRVANARGYTPVCKTWCNLICVRNDLVHLLENRESSMYDFLNEASGIIHVGASFGQERALYAEHDLPVLWLEPLTDVYGALAGNIREYSKQIALQYLVVDTDGQEWKFGVANNRSQSSSVLPLNLHRRIYPEVYYVEERTLTGYRLDTILEKNGIDAAKYDTLVIDVQGAELLVLKGAGDLLNGINRIFTEAWDYEAYTGCCRLSDLDEYLAPFGFKRVATYQHDGSPEIGYTYDVLYERTGHRLAEISPNGVFSGNAEAYRSRWQSQKPHTGLQAMGAMEPVKEPSPETPQAPSEPLIYGYTEQELIDARAQRAEEGKLMIAACMSTPRFGPLITMDLIQSALSQFSIPWFRGEGGYWHHQLTDSIERALQLRPDAILTFDYDSMFCTAPNDSDIAKLVTLLLENPDVEIIAPMQMKREGGELLASSNGEVRISDPLIPVDWAHFGMTIFRASVFERLSKPWFWERPDEKGGWGEGRIDADIGFWKNCQEHGVRLCVATDVLLGHGEYNVTYPGDDLKPVYVTMNQWRKNGQKPPADAFNRQRFIEKALKGEMPIAKVLDMGN